MRGWLYLLLTLAILPFSLGARIQAQAPVDTALYAVSYVDVMPSTSSAMIAAYKQYRDASPKEPGYVKFELLEQVGRPGHFVVLETWKDQQGFDAHGMAAHMKQFQDALQSIRLSGYDQRPYKPLTVASAADVRAGGTIHVVAHVDIAGGTALAGALETLKGLAEASRKEQGCLRFDVLQHTMRQNHFTIVEIWQNQRAHDAHAAAAHTKQYRDRVQPITGSPVDERVYRAIE